MTQTYTTPLEFFTIAGATTPLSFPHRFDAEADLLVYEDGVLQTQGADYTTTGVGVTAGGTVVPIAATVSSTWTVIRRSDIDQTSNPSDATAGIGLDTLTRKMQELETRLDRSMQIAIQHPNGTPNFDALDGRVMNVGTPTDDDDATPKTYVDGEIASLAGLRLAAAASAFDAAADAASAAADAASIAGDVLITNADVVLTNADVVLTHADAASTAADLLATNQDTIDTAADAAATAADLLATNQDTIDTAADAAATAADRVQTGLDATATSADAASIAGAEAATAADRVQTGLDAAATAADVIAAAASATAADVAKIEWQGDWATATAYALNDAVNNADSSYICIVAHTSGTFATDLAAAKWEVLAAKGADGIGAGDMLAANNLSDLVDAPAALANIGATAALALKAPLTSPALTGNPTAPTQTTGNDTTRIATTEFVQQEIAAIPDPSDLISHTIFNNDATAEFTLPAITGNERGYKISFRDVAGSTNCKFYMRVKVAGAWVTASEYHDGTQARIANDIDISFSGDLFIFSPQIAEYTRFICTAHRSTNGTYSYENIVSAHEVDVAVEALQFYKDSGNLVSGTATLSSLGGIA